MDIHPELEFALQSIIRFWPWIAGALITLLFIGGMIWKLWPVPYIRTSLKAAVAPYTVETVSRWTIYHVWCSKTSRGQEFVVLNVLNDHFFIGVLNCDWIFKKRSERFAFKGWTQIIPHDRLIGPEDLLRALPGKNFSSIDRLLNMREN